MQAFRGSQLTRLPPPPSFGVRPTRLAAVEMPNWSTLFDEAEPKPGCSEEEVRELLAAVARPLDSQQLTYYRGLMAVNPYPPGTPERDTYVPSDPAGWPLPSRGLPASYLSFLRWSNGGAFRSRHRRVEFIAARWVRSVMLQNLFPMAAPHVVPFAGVPGEGDWYAFDTVAEPVGGEFPVVYVKHGGTMREPMPLAATFPDFCRGADQEDAELYWDWWGRRHGCE